MYRCVRSFSPAADSRTFVFISFNFSDFGLYLRPALHATVKITPRVVASTPRRRTLVRRGLIPLLSISNKGREMKEPPLSALRECTNVREDGGPPQPQSRLTGQTLPAISSTQLNERTNMRRESIAKQISSYIFAVILPYS